MENKFCQWCSSPKNWLRWLVGAAIVMLVFCSGMAIGRFSGFNRGGQCGFERGGFQQSGYNRNQMMRGGRNGRYFTPNAEDEKVPTGQYAPVTNQVAPAATTTIPAK